MYVEALLREDLGAVVDKSRRAVGLVAYGEEDHQEEKGSEKAMEGHGRRRCGEITHLVAYGEEDHQEGSKAFPPTE